MGKKYIVEIGDNENLYKTMIANGGRSYMAVVYGEPYTEPYTELDLEQARKEAYEEGFDVGRTLNTGKYEKGLNDAWDAARKIIRMPEGDLLNLFDVYSSVCTSVQAILKYDASEAIDKIRQYEQEQDAEIKVGDEVVGVFSDGKETRPFVFMRGTQEYYFGMYSDTGEFCRTVRLNLRKTGRHFPEIAAVLEKMRGDQK